MVKSINNLDVVRSLIRLNKGFILERFLSLLMLRLTGEFDERLIKEDET